MREGMRIGELAACFRLNPKTIRFYEEIGLLPPADRTDSGYRQYDERDAERLGFIRRAKLLGLSLDEIRDLLSLAECGEQPCRRVLGLIDAKIGEIDRQVQELQEVRTELGNLRSIWTDRDSSSPPGASVRVCPIIEEQSEVTEHSDMTRILKPVGRCHSD